MSLGTEHERMKKELPQHNRRPVISASEIAEFAYCAKAWHLKRCGEEAQGEHLAEGVAFHARHGAGVSQARSLHRLARLLILLALLLLVVLLWHWLSAAMPR